MFNRKSKTCRALLSTLLLLAAVMSWPLLSLAKIDLVTVPSRDETQITIYNSEDITLVDEKRLITFKEGRNEIQFSWAGTLIDPTSLSLEFLEHKDSFEVLDVNYPANTQNVLIWNVESKHKGVAPIKISYFLSGLTWSADYVLRANVEETLAGLEGYVRVTNYSGEDFENTKVRLVVGKINLVEKIADLARQQGWDKSQVRRAKAEGMREAVVMMDFAAAPSAMAAPKIEKEELGDYFIYTVEGRDDIPNGWSKRLKSLTADEVPIEVVYKHDVHASGNNVMKYYRFYNKEESNLGEEPLPDGMWNVFIERQGSKIFPVNYAGLPADGRGMAMGLSFQNAITYKYIPMGEKIDLTIGADGLITVEALQMKFKRDAIDFDTHGYVIGWDETEAWKIEVRNSKDRSVPVELMRYFTGDFDLSSDDDHEKESEYIYKFIVNTPPKGEKTIEYTVVTRKGSNAKK